MRKLNSLLLIICLLLIMPMSSAFAVFKAGYQKTTDLPASTAPVAGSTVHMDVGSSTVKVALSDVVASAANIGAATIVTVGALDSGSITSNFGTINNGASNIDTTGDITGGAIEATGDTAAGDNSAHGYTATEGLVLTGQGSTNDVTIKNDADADVIVIPTGTTTPTIADDTTLTTGTIILADGGTVTQITSRATGVTLSTHSGQITTDTTSLAAGAEATFTVTNTIVTALDTIIVNAASGQTAGTSVPIVSAVGSGSFDITLTNLHASTADTGAMVINFVVLRGASS